MNARRESSRRVPKTKTKININAKGKTMNFIKQAKRAGSTQTTINVELNGVPFGQLWTWPNTKTERHPWHAKPLNGEHKVFQTLNNAKRYMMKFAGIDAK